MWCCFQRSSSRDLDEVLTSELLGRQVTCKQGRDANEKGDGMISSVTRRKTLENFIGLQSAPNMAAGPHAISQIHGFAIPGSAKQAAYSVLQVETRSRVTGYGECRPLSMLTWWP